MFNCRQNNFIEPIEKIMYINKLNLPNELIYILKDYIFYNIRKMNFIKEMSQKKKLVNIRIKIAYSRKLYYDLNILRGFKEAAQEYETMENWMFGFPHSDYSSIETTVLRGSNCKKCGEYEYICIEKYRNVPSNIKLCNC